MVSEIPPFLRSGADEAAPAEAAISTLTYRSLAPVTPSLADMETLLAHARTRNRRLGVTGMLLFAQNQFYQWLEGPDDGVMQVWDAIRKDPRHGGIELIDHAPGGGRLFGEWDMKFVSNDRDLAWIRDREDGRHPMPTRLTDTFATMAMAGDVAGLCGGLEELILMGHDLPGLHRSLIEPAARRLGAWWRDDRVSAAEVGLGLSYIQAAVRRVGAGQTDAGDTRAAAMRALVVCQPGEAHGLGASLVADVFRRTGWRVDLDFPEDDGALRALVRSTWYDVLAMSLSDVFSRLERLPAMAQTVRSVRQASVNSGLVIVVGGLAFRNQPGLVGMVGADASYASCADAATAALRQFGAGGAADTDASPVH